MVDYELLEFERIKYIEEVFNPEDFSYIETISKIKKDYSLIQYQYLVKNRYNKNEKTERILLSTKRYSPIPHDLVDGFVLDALMIVGSPERHGITCDDHSGRLDIIFKDNFMKIKADKSIAKDNQSIESLWCKLMMICEGLPIRCDQ